MLGVAGRGNERHLTRDARLANAGSCTVAGNALQRVNRAPPMDHYFTNNVQVLLEDKTQDIDN